MRTHVQSRVGQGSAAAGNLCINDRIDREEGVNEDIFCMCVLALFDFWEMGIARVVPKCSATANHSVDDSLDFDEFMKISVG